MKRIVDFELITLAIKKQDMSNFLSILSLHRFRYVLKEIIINNIKKLKKRTQDTRNDYKT